MPSRMLSKSRYLNGLQCPRLLWIVSNEPDRLPKPDAVTRYAFDQGHEIGKLSHSLYPDGVFLGVDDFAGNLRATKSALRLRRPLFEAGIYSGQLYCRTDILVPAGEDDWDIIEVKSSTEVRDEHLHDVAFQRHVCSLAGLPIRRCHVMHLNREYIRYGDIELGQLLVSEDVTAELDILSIGIEDSIESMLQCIMSTECPCVTIGRHCGDPYPCALQPECWAHLPDQNVMTLNRGKKLGEELLGCGILDIRQIPDGVPLNAKQSIQKECAATGKPQINAVELRGFLKELIYPLYFMDFETFKTAIPLYDGTRPYQNIPFQFSLHVVEHPGGEPRHYSFLARGKDDPRPGFMAALTETLGAEGTVLVYNQAFEKSVLAELAQFLPRYQPWVDDVLARIVDLMAPFRGFLYYHPDQCGSASLKRVMPALTGMSYDYLCIADGQMASLAYVRATFGEMPEEERQQVRNDLEIYCGQDTGGMVEIVKRLGELAA